MTRKKNPRPLYPNFFFVYLQEHETTLNVRSLTFCLWFVLISYFTYYSICQSSQSFRYFVSPPSLLPFDPRFQKCPTSLFGSNPSTTPDKPNNHYKWGEGHPPHMTCRTERHRLPYNWPYRVRFRTLHVCVLHRRTRTRYRFSLTENPSTTRRLEPERLYDRLSGCRPSSRVVRVGPTPWRWLDIPRTLRPKVTLNSDKQYVVIYQWPLTIPLKTHFWNSFTLSSPSTDRPSAKKVRLSFCSYL